MDMYRTKTEITISKAELYKSIYLIDQEIASIKERRRPKGRHPDRKRRIRLGGMRAVYCELLGLPVKSKEKEGEPEKVQEKL